MFKKIFHAFLFNIKNYSPEVRNIPRREAKLNITLLKVNNSNIKQKIAWNICFIIYPKHQTIGEWMSECQQGIEYYSDNITTFFKKKLPRTIILNYLILIVVIIFWVC